LGIKKEQFYGFDNVFLVKQGCCASGKPGKPGKIREFNFALENLEKLGNFTPLSGKTIFFFSKINFGVYFGQ